MLAQILVEGLRDLVCVVVQQTPQLLELVATELEWASVARLEGLTTGLDGLQEEKEKKKCWVCKNTDDGRCEKNKRI